MNINPNTGVILNGMDRSNIEAKSKNLENLEDKKLKDVCQDFESVFLYMVMKEMRKNVPNEGLIEKSQASLMFEDMYMEELSKEISKSDKGIGLADMMYEQLTNKDKLIIR